MSILFTMPLQWPSCKITTWSGSTENAFGKINPGCCLKYKSIHFFFSQKTWYFKVNLISLNKEFYEIFYTIFLLNMASLVKKVRVWIASVSGCYMAHARYLQRYLLAASGFDHKCSVSHLNDLSPDFKQITTSVKWITEAVICSRADVSTTLVASCVHVKQDTNNQKIKKTNVKVTGSQCRLSTKFSSISR